MFFINNWKFFYYLTFLLLIYCNYAIGEDKYDEDYFDSRGKFIRFMDFMYICVCFVCGKFFFGLNLSYFQMFIQKYIFQ